MAHPVFASPKGGKAESHSRVFCGRQGQGTRQSSDSMSAHTLPSICASPHSPRMVSNRLFPGSRWDVCTHTKWGNFIQRARNFSNSVMRTCLRTEGQSLICFTLWSGCSYSNHLSPVSMGWKKSPNHKKSQIQERSPFLYSHGVCNTWV